MRSNIMSKFNRRSNVIVRRRGKADGGMRLLVPPHPTEFVSNPWWNVVVRIINPPALVTTNILHAAIVSQLGITAPAVEVRLQNVKLWGAIVAQNAQTVLQPIQIHVQDPIALSTASGNGGIGQRELMSITDFPDQVSRSRVGYVYPKAQREFAIAVTPTSAGALWGINGGVGNGAIMLVYVQLRFSGSATSMFEFEDLGGVETLTRHGSAPCILCRH